MGGKRKDWSEEQLRACAAMWADGVAHVDIARRFGISQGSLGDLMRRHRARFPLRQQLKGAWSDEEIACVNRCFEQAMTYGQAARNVSRSRNAIIAYVARHPEKFRNVPKINDDGGNRGARAIREKRAGKGGHRNPFNLLTDAAIAPRFRGDGPMREALPGVVPVAFAALRDLGQCRFPLSADGAPAGPDMPCCGAAIALDARYCAAHAALTYRPRPEKAPRGGPKGLSAFERQRAFAPKGRGCTARAIAHELNRDIAVVEAVVGRGV